MVRVDGRKWSDNFLVISELLAGSFNGKGRRRDHRITVRVMRSREIIR